MTLLNSDELVALAGQIDDRQALRAFVLARAIVIAQEKNDSTGIKALELIARLELGDVAPRTEGNYLDHLESLTDDELQYIQESAERMTARLLNDRAKPDGYTNQLEDA